MVGLFGANALVVGYQRIVGVTNIYYRSDKGRAEIQIAGLEVNLIDVNCSLVYRPAETIEPRSADKKSISYSTDEGFKMFGLRIFHSSSDRL